MTSRTALAEKLLPCPFCGGIDLAVLKGNATLHDAIKCRPCNLFLPLTVDEWNRRALRESPEDGMERDTYLLQRLSTAVDISLLEAPCAFCAYNGPNYWQAHSHKKNCPWHEVAGGKERELLLPQTIRALAAAPENAAQEQKEDKSGN